MGEGIISPFPTIPLYPHLYPYHYFLHLASVLVLMLSSSTFLFSSLFYLFLPLFPLLPLSLLFLLLLLLLILLLLLLLLSQNSVFAIVRLTVHITPSCVLVCAYTLLVCIYIRFLL